MYCSWFCLGLDTLWLYTQLDESGQLHVQVGPSIVIAIAANKQDLLKLQTVSTAESEAYATSITALHVGTSAKTGAGLEDIFQAIADQVVAKSPPTGSTYLNSMTAGLSCKGPLLVVPG